MAQNLSLRRRRYRSCSEISLCGGVDILILDVIFICVGGRARCVGFESLTKLSAGGGSPLK